VRIVAYHHRRDVNVRRRHIWNTRTQDGETALIMAAGEGHADCARLLLDAGADTRAKDRVRHLKRSSNAGHDV
jgi:ankyrin repeat protein